MAADVEEGAAVASIVASSHCTLQTRAPRRGKSFEHLSASGASATRLVKYAQFLPQRAAVLDSHTRTFYFQ